MRSRSNVPEKLTTRHVAIVSVAILSLGTPTSLGASDGASPRLPAVQDAVPIFDGRDLDQLPPPTADSSGTVKTSIRFGALPSGSWITAVRVFVATSKAVTVSWGALAT